MSYNFSRREALRMLILGGATLGASQLAFADTQSQLNDAQKKLEAAQKQIDDISAQYEELSKKQSETLNQIESKQGEIDSTQADIDKKEAELKEKKEVLGKRISETYKGGGTDILSILFSSANFNELTSNIYYADKVAARDRSMIEEVKKMRAELSQHKAQLETEKADLEALNETQKSQLKDMQAKQIDVQNIINNLSQDVKDLMAKRDAELEAMAAEKARQQAAAGSNRGSNAGGGSKNSGGGSAQQPSGQVPSNSGNISGGQARVLAACRSVGSPGVGLCAMWVSQVFYRAGFPYASGNANDMYNAWCYSSNKGALQPGMIVAVSSHPHTTAGRIYGHIGIYVGGGMVMDNIGYIRTIDLNSWISYYGSTVTPRWGWLMGIKLA